MRWKRYLNWSLILESDCGWLIYTPAVRRAGWERVFPVNILHQEQVMSKYRKLRYKNIIR